MVLMNFEGLKNKQKSDRSIILIFTKNNEKIYFGKKVPKSWQYLN